MVELTEDVLISLLKEAPRTANEIARIVGSHHFTVYKALMRLILENKPIRVKKIGRYEIFWYDFFGNHMRKVAKNMYGDTLDESDLILITLFDNKAFDEASAVSIHQFKENLLKALEKEKRIVIIGNKVYLTKIGKDIARGLKDIWLTPKNKGKTEKVSLPI